MIVVLAELVCVFMRLQILLSVGIVCFHGVYGLVPIMDINSNNRLNFSKSIYIGDHVWCGQEIGILNLYLRV